jgi:nitrate/nitrite transport system ATP-binding protein
MEPLIELNHVSKSYGSGSKRVQVLHDLNLKIYENEFTALVGFSGTGKTTLMSMLAGLVAPDVGEILYKGKPVTGPSPERGIVFQNYSLLPWLTVRGNVALAVNHMYSNLSKKERDGIIRKYVEMVNLTPALDKRPKELSGGMRQRTSVARALSADPDVLLLDEPLSALDALTRAVLQDQILEIWEESKKTIVLITNSVDEAIYLADRIIPLTLQTPSTFGPEFCVGMDRPRERSAMNHDETYRCVRNDIIKFLMNQKKNQTLEKAKKEAEAAA